MSTSRNKINFNRFDDFIEFCNEEGWIADSLKGPAECLRMYKGKKCLILYSNRKQKEFFTTCGWSDIMADKLLGNTPKVPRFDPK